MSKFINTILVCTTIMCCSNVNSSDYKIEVWNYLNCNVRDVTNLSIDTSSGINSNDYGRLFYYKDNVKVYPVDNDGKYFYDLQSRIDTVKTNSKSLFKSDSEWSGGNLVVIPTGVKSKITNMGKTLTIGTCSLTNPNGFAPGANVTVNIPSETNLIVPQYILLNTNKIQLKFDQGSYNNKLLILGKITTDNNTADECISIVGNNGSGNNRTVIFGPRSFVRNGKSLHKSIIKSTNDKYINYILYPGCVLGDDAQYNKHGNKKLCNKNNCLFKESGNIYMNRFGFLDTLNYREHCNRLFGLIGKSFNLFFPGNTKMIEQEICISTEDDNNPGTYKLNHLSPFIKLYWAGSFNSHINGTNSIGKYISKYPEKTLDFVEDKTGKKVLNINPNNPLARCDIAYCDKFSVHDYNYGLNRLYNTKDNIDKYINVDTIDDLFYNGKDCCNEFCKGADLNASELINILVDGLSDFYTTDNFYNTEKIIRLTMKMYSFFSQFTDKVIIKLLNNRDDFNSFFPGFFGEITKNLLLLIRIVEKSEDGELLSLLSEFVEKQPEITADLEDTFQIIIKITLPYLIQAKNLLLRLVPFIDNISSNNFISNINLDEIAKLFNRVRDVLGTFLDGIKTSQQDPETEDIIVLTLKEAVDKHISENENNSEPDILNILDQKEFSIGSTVVLKKSKKDFNPKLVFSIFGYNLPIAHIPLELITKLNFKQTVDISSLVYGPQTFKYFTDNIPKDDTTAEYATFKKQTQQQISNMINGLLSAVNVDAFLKHLFHAFNGLLSVDIKYSKIYPGLIGNKPIVINSSGTDILLYGDNSEFNSKIFFSNLNYKKTLSLYNPNSMVNIENANILNLCSNNYIMWDLAKFSNEVKFDITNQDSRNCSICFIDNSIKKKYNIMKFTGNNNNYKANEDINNSGIVYIPSTITDLVFANPNNKVLISTNKYVYTGIDDNNALELIKDTSGSGIQNIHIGKDAIPLNKNSKEWNSYFTQDDGKIIRNIDTVKYLEFYNKEGVIWNTDKLEQCFEDGRGLLNNMPDIIYSDLIGTKPIIIKTTNTEVKILGDTSKYKGKITIPTTVTDLYLNANLLCQIIHDGYNDLKHLHLYFNRGHSNIVDWDLAISNVLDEALKNEAGRDKAFVLSDSGGPGYKQTKVIIKGNNIGFKGIIITTPEVKEVVFGKNSFVRTVNINGTPLKYTFTGDNKVIDYNDYETLETKNKNVKVNVISNNGSSHLKNEIIHGKKKTNINVEKINVGKNGRLTFGPNNPLFLGKK